MTEAENLSYRDIFYRHGSTMPEWLDPNATCDSLMFNLKQYDESVMPNLSQLSVQRQYPRSCGDSLKNVSPHRFKNARRKSKQSRIAKRRNRKR